MISLYICNQKTREIITKGTQIACDPLAAAIYRIKSKWYVLTPGEEQLTSAPMTIRPGLLPWGRDSAVTASEIDDVNQELDANSELPMKELIASYRSITIAFISCIALIIIAITVMHMAADMKIHLPASGRSRNSADFKTSSGRPCCTSDDADLPREVSHEHVHRRPEILHRAHNERLDVQDELANLRNAYRALEVRINSCTPPTQTGLNRLAVAPSQGRSQDNEGGVTYGAPLDARRRP